ncbi:ABC transporter substrate-binding protein [Schaalia sp. ZJ405]|uniref:peptide ABC transporter substrate-binding protein n=1 Tax=Schaalia sp. ZJ405 TaxID=2709403 RepID=UPI0013ECFD3E|nr:ABC transporter substrate-binding protein [Schaalia sp. ZJ405]QPK81473.1 ABC transporter substrate-binding protein [Schaalia sp. ZJ405]
MNLKRTWLVVPAALALGLSACSGGNAGSSSSSQSGTVEATPDAIITVNGSEPQNPLLPGNTNEVGGGKLVDLLFAGLIYYDAKGEAHNDMAESIEPNEDSSVWTIKLKKGQKFSDGTEVKAHNFIEAWNKVTDPKSPMLNTNFFVPIEGTDKEGVGMLTGLKADEDDYGFTVTLKEPTSDFGLRLGYSAFYPLPDSTLENPEAGGEMPIANGPYKLKDENAWEHNSRIQLVANPDYKGERQPKNGGITVVFYASLDAAFADLQSGVLDVLDAIPDSAFSTYEGDLKGRSVNQPAAIFQSFAIPESLEHFSGEEGKLRREAISYAIDRETITKKVFQDTRTPAKDFSSPVIPGFMDSISGNDVLTYNPKKAKELWEKADAISPWSGKFTIAYNSDGGHQAWVDAATNSIKNALGIEAEGNPYPEFKSLRTDITNRTIKGAFRTGWQADYPSMLNFLSPIYATGAGSNDTDYSSKEFDGLLAQASSAPTVDEANEFLYKAQEVLLKDLPVIPLWYANVVGGWAEGVNNVTFDWHSVPVYTDITKN